jgi:hypothetical protein
LSSAAASDALALVRAALAPPPARVREEATGFAWRPHAFEQRIAWGPAGEDAARLLEASVRLLSGVEGGAGVVAALAAWNAREPGLSSLRWDSTAGEVALRAAVIVRPGDGGAAARRLAHAALLQLGDAIRAADALAVKLPAAALAEGAGALPPVAQVEAWRVYADGAVAASTANRIAEQVTALAASAPGPWRRITATAHGIDAEIECAPVAESAGQSAEVALLRMSATQPHPRLGPGIVQALVPPASAEPVAERAAATAALLQEGEAREWTGVDALGGWCVHPAAGLSHVVFVPAMAAEEDTAATLAGEAVVRARWATTFLAGVRALR